MKIEVYEPRRAHTGERPIWDAETGSLFWIDIFGRRIFRKDSGGAVTSWAAPALVGSMALVDEGRALVALHHGFHLFDLATGRFDLIADPDPSAAGNLRLNDGKVDPRGRFLCGGADYFRAAPIAGLYLVDHALGVTTVMDDIILTNSITWSPDGSILYFADTYRRVLYRCSYELETGAVGPREIFATFEGDGLPDGAVTDDDGGIWVALVYGGEIVRFKPSGERDITIPFPVIAPTSLCFGGPDMQTLFVTSKSVGPDGRELDVERGAGAVFTITGLGIRGQPERRFIEKRAAP
jgi:L-arabinonolactonase